MRYKYFFIIIINISLILKGINKLFGTTKKRILHPGEEATIIETIYKILDEAKNDISILAINGV